MEKVDYHLSASTGYPAASGESSPREPQQKPLQESLREFGGFTLVELAISLMVIGLLIGGILKGQELVENARVTADIRNIKALDAAAPKQ